MTTAYEIALNLFNNSYGDSEYRMTASEADGLIREYRICADDGEKSVYDGITGDDVANIFNDLVEESLNLNSRI